MLENLFFKIGLLYTKIRFFGKKDKVQKFTTFLYQDSRILVIMPFELGEFDTAKSTMLNIKNEWPGLQISMVVQAQYLTYSGLAGAFSVFALGVKDINKFSLPKKRFMKPILAHDYDIVIDFNKDMVLTSSFISKRVDVKYRVSFVKEYVDMFFNVQFNQKSVILNKNIYLSLLNKLKLFYSNEKTPKPKIETKEQTSKPTQKISEENKFKKDTKEQTKKYIKEKPKEDTTGKEGNKENISKENTIGKEDTKENISKEDTTGKEDTKEDTTGEEDTKENISKEDITGKENKNNIEREKYNENKKQSKRKQSKYKNSR